MRKMVAAVAVLLVLTGCSATEPVDVEGALENIESKDEQTADAQPAPLEAEQPQEAAPATPEDEFLNLVRPVVEDSGQISDASDEQLLAAAQDACAQMSEGKIAQDVRVVEGEEPSNIGYYSVSLAIASAADELLCDS